MKTMRNLFLLCAGLSLFACSSDDEVTNQFPEGNGAVTVKIVNPSARAISNATTNGQGVNGNITLTLTHSGQAGTSTKTITYTDGVYKDGETTLTVNDKVLTVVFYNIGTPSKLTASMNGGLASYDDIAINADGTNSTPNMQATPENIPVYGETESFTKSGEVINDGNSDYVEYDASIQLEIPVARLEIQVGVGNTFTGFSSVSLAGAYLDNIKPTAAGTITDYRLQYDNSATQKGEDAILCDNYFASEGILKTEGVLSLMGNGAATSLPGTNTYFAYNFYAGTNPEFKLCLKVEGSDIQNPIPGIQYAIVNNFVDSSTSNPVTFEAGKIYKVTNLTLNGNNIQVDESGTQLAYALTATVTQASWEVITTVNGSWAQGNN